MEIKNKVGKAFLFALPHTVPILTGYLIMGIAYGILMDFAGYNALWSWVVSLMTTAGSMQFFTVDLLGVPFDPLVAFVMAIMVNARHSFYSLAMLEKYNKTGNVKPFLIFVLTDEVFSVVTTVKPKEDISEKWFYFAVTFCAWIYWSTGAMLGGVIGSFVTFNIEGIDFVLTALFVVLFLEQIKDKSNVKSGFVGIFATLAALFIVGGGTSMVLVAMGIIIVVFYFGRKKSCN